MGSLPKGKMLWASLQRAASVNSCLKCRLQFGAVLPRNDAKFHRFFSSKTPINSSVLPAVVTETVGSTVPATTSEPAETSPATTTTPEPAPVPALPVFSGVDIRTADEDTRKIIHNVSTQLATAQAYSLINARNKRKRKEILVMEEEEYAGTYVLQKRPPLLDRRAENESYFFRSFAPDKQNNIDTLCTLQADIDMRPHSLKRWYRNLKRDTEISNQIYDRNREIIYNPQRHKMLGSDLAAAHFLVYRKGKVKFLGRKDWVTEYRKDAKPGVDDDDLPSFRFELCTLPTKYDPRFRVEAIDAQGVELHYEGFDNLENLHYLKWISLRESPYINDWCLDRLARMFNETLEYIDVSGCKGVTDRGIGTLHRCRKLKAIRAENMPHLEDLEIVSAMLEDHIPDLQVIGVDYKGKMEQMRLEAEEMEQKALLAGDDEKKLLQDYTLDVKQSEQKETWFWTPKP